MTDHAGAPGDRDEETAGLQAAREGDRDAIEAILRAHVPQVHAICTRLCRDRGDAQDAAQEALLSIARGLAGFDGTSKLSTWIYRITTNACMDELRRRRRRPEPVDTSDEAIGVWSHDSSPGRHVSPESAVIAMDTRAEIADALADLPEEFRIAVVLRDVVDLDYATIAEMTQVPVGTVRSRIARGRGRLADALGAGTEPAAHTSEDPGADSTQDRT